jgi:hypothetical protein
LVKQTVEERLLLFQLLAKVVAVRVDNLIM